MRQEDREPAVIRHSLLDGSAADDMQGRPVPLTPDTKRAYDVIREVAALRTDEDRE